MSKTEFCSVCGAIGTYAKHLCRPCYERALRNGGVPAPRMSEQTKAKWKGVIVNGWEVLDTLPKSQFLVRCIHCGRTKIVVRSTIRNQSIRPCVCHIELLEPRTEAQARIYKAVLKNKGNASQAAKDLGLSRQAVHSVLNTMRRNKDV